MRKALATAQDRVVRNEQADILRTKCKDDLKYFYTAILDQNKLGLGRIHDWVLDFLRLEELASLPSGLRHSTLCNYLPGMDGRKFKERWIYWPSLNEEPQIQDGPDGEISTMFHEKPWLGIIVRVDGDCLRRCLMLPRGHLKTELGSKANVLWRMLRNPKMRCMVRSATDPLACMILESLKNPFEANEAFIALFGDLKPLRNEGVWKSNAMQIVCKDRIGKEPTVMSQGMSSEVTGFHFDYMVLDDVVGEQNVATKVLRDQAKASVQRLSFVRDPGAPLLDIGTAWSDDDVHAMYTRRDSPSYVGTSFLVATVYDNNNQPLWPEVFTKEVIENKRIECPDAHTWACQYFNQPRMGNTCSFKADWIKWYATEGAALVRSEMLDIAIVVDPANSERKNSDYSACLVMGQTKDGGRRYLLDGFRERLSDAKLPGRITDIIEKWQEIARLCKVSFRFAIEDFSFQKYIQYPLRDEMRKRGCSAYIESVKAGTRNKTDRIRRLATPFSCGAIVWPERLVVHTDTGSYDMIADLKDEYLSFPSGKHDDMLDCMAYIEEMLRPVDMKAMPVMPQESKKQSKNEYNREEAAREWNRQQLANRGSLGRYMPARDAYHREKFGSIRNANRRSNI